MRPAAGGNPALARGLRRRAQNHPAAGANAPRAALTAAHPSQPNPAANRRIPPAQRSYPQCITDGAMQAMVKNVNGFRNRQLPARTLHSMFGSRHRVERMAMPGASINRQFQASTSSTSFKHQPQASTTRLGKARLKHTTVFRHPLVHHPHPVRTRVFYFPWPPGFSPGFSIGFHWLPAAISPLSISPLSAGAAQPIPSPVAARRTMRSPACADR